jgi:hypothetical protein
MILIIRANFIKKEKKGGLAGLVANPHQGIQTGGAAASLFRAK